MDGEETAASAKALATELTKARQRGLDEIDMNIPTKPYVALPLLEDLARRYSGDSDRGRTELIEHLLRNALQAYGTARSEREAEFVERLFFDERTGEAPGPKRPGGLLDAVRQASRLNDDAFDKRRLAVFRNFAEFLLSFGVESPTPPEQPATPPEQDASKPRHRRGLIMLAAAVLALAVVGTVVLLTRSDGGAHPTDNAASSTTAGPLMTLT